MATKVGLLHAQLRLLGAQSLKEKRSRLKPLIAQLQKRFQVAVAEVGFQDEWQAALIAVALVSSDGQVLERRLQSIITWLDNEYRDVELVQDSIEIIQ